VGLGRRAPPSSPPCRAAAAAAIIVVTGGSLSAAAASLLWRLVTGEVAAASARSPGPLDRSEAGAFAERSGSISVRVVFQVNE
jgi:hypothetical protein